MKNLILILLIIPLSIFAQVEKPPMLHYEYGIFTNFYTLGSKKITDKELALHLEKNSPQAYYQYRRSNAHNAIALGFLTAALGFEIWHLSLVLRKKPSETLNNRLLASGFGAVTFAVGAGFSISSIVKRKKARDIYNRQFGY